MSALSAIKTPLRQAWLALYGPSTIPHRIEPRRVLLVNGAHVGDVVISTSLIPVLKSAYPSIELGFITGTWSREVVADHPDINHTHCVDHWLINRGHSGLREKVKRYADTSSQALGEIRKINYDLAIHVHRGYRDLVGISWRAGIPVRIAFTGSLWAPFASALAAYPSDRLFMTEGACQAELLRTLHISSTHLARRKASLGPSTSNDLHEVARLIGTANLDATPFRIVHIGSGAAYKELSASFWQKFVSYLPPTQILLFTGRGDRESSMINAIIAGFDNCINASNKLSWGGFVAAVRRADVLYGVDSMAGHVAAAVGTKCITVSTGVGGVPRWRPEGSDATVWTNPTPCTPCFRPHGCEHMSCLSGITPADLLSGV